MSSNTDDSTGQDGLRIPVIEEQLALGTCTVDTGRGVRIHKTVSEQAVTIDERLLREEVDVRRVTVDRVVPEGAAPAPRYEGDTLVVPVLEEVLVVERRLRIKEELHITRIRREERYHDTVRHTEVDVQRLDGGTARSDLRDDDSYFRKHFTSTYGATGVSYDDYAPAYSYGAQMAGSGRYTGRQWDEVESDLRTDWEPRYSGGPSTWEKMKAAVRHGWDRMTGDSGGSRTY